MSRRAHICLAAVAASFAAAEPAGGTASSPPLHRISTVLTGADPPDVLGVATDHRYAYFQPRVGTLRLFDSFRRRSRDVGLPEGRSCLPTHAAGGDVLVRCGVPGATAPGSPQDLHLVIAAATGRAQPVPVDGGKELWRIGRVWIHGVAGGERGFYVHRRTGEVHDLGEADPYPPFDLDSETLQVDRRPRIRFAERRCRDGRADCLVATYRRGRRELGRARGRGTYVEQEPPIATWYDHDTAHALDVRDGRTYLWRFGRRAPGGAVVQHTDRAAFFVRPARRGRYPLRSELFVSYLER